MTQKAEGRTFFFYRRCFVLLFIKQYKKNSRVPHRARTGDLRLIRPTLLPTELVGQTTLFHTCAPGSSSCPETPSRGRQRTPHPRRRLP